MANSFPKNIVVIDTKPKGIAVVDIKSKDIAVIDTKPKSVNIFGETTIYLENRTILQGQPIPWGLNWLITYPVNLTFTGPRL